MNNGVPNLSGNTAVSSTSSIAILQTSPPHVLVHRIEDRELQSLTNISRPISLTVASTATGAWLGLIPTCAAVLDKLSTKPQVALTVADVLVCVVWVVCFVVSLIFGFQAGAAIVDANKLLKNIRDRPPTQI